jgi:hypothetical protein
LLRYEAQINGAASELSGVPQGIGTVIRASEPGAHKRIAELAPLGFLANDERA